MSQKKPKEENTRFPPKIPAELKELERAIMLLGSRIKVELGSAPRAALESLLGSYPSVAQAQVWKISLSKIRRERVGTANPKPPTGESA